MTRTKVKIQVKNTLLDESVLMLGKKYANKWKIPAQEPVFLSFGSAKLEVRIIPVARLNALRLSGSLAERLGLQNGDLLCLRYKPAERTLKIGPLIGVLVSRFYSQTPDRPFGSMTAFCEELTRACEEYGAHVYFFTPEERSDDSHTVNGWIHQGQWSKRPFPVADVIYNRLTTRKLENSDDVRRFLEAAKVRRRSVVFNEKYLDKSEVFDALQREADLQHFLPESRLFKHGQQLKTMCAKHGVVFLKPVTGSLGKGIVRVASQANGSYLCYFNNPIGVRKQSYPTLKKLTSNMEVKMKKSYYQIQQGLNLITVGNRPVDFRVLVQRNRAGEWSVTSAVGRIAANDNFVSNLARGGSLCTVEEAAAGSDLPAGSRAGLTARLRHAALAVALGLMRQLPGHFAELGIDLAVDTNGKIWLLEVNSKPSKDDKTASGAAKIRPSVRKLVQYSQFAAKF